MSGSFITILGFLFAATQTLANSSHQDGSNRVHHSDLGGRSANCLEELDVEQFNTLARVKRIARQSVPPTELAQRIYSELNNPNLTPAKRDAVAALAFSELQTQAQKFLQSPEGPEKEAVEQLIQYGARFENGELDLKKLQLNHLAKFQESLKKVYPDAKDQISKISDPENNIPVVLGSTIILGRLGFGDNQEARINTTREYQTSVQETLSRLQAAFRNYQESSNKANSSSNMAFAVFGTHKPAEVESDKDYKALLNALNTLRVDYGYPNEKLEELRNLIFQENAQGNRNLDKAMSEITWAAGAIALAPLAYPILAVAAGASLTASGTLWAGTTAAGVKAVVVGAGIAAAFVAVDNAGTLAINKSYGNGNLSCYLGKQLLQKGPMAFATVIVGGVLGGISQSAPTLAKLIGVGMMGKIAYDTPMEYFSAQQLDAFAREAELDGEGELAKEYRKLAAQARLNVSQGIAAGLLLPTTIAYKSISNRIAANRARVGLPSGEPPVEPITKPVTVDPLASDATAAARRLGLAGGLSPEQAARLESAHRIGAGEIGRDGINPAGIKPDGSTNYTPIQIRHKFLELMRPDPKTGRSPFTVKQAKTLLREGYAGIRGGEIGNVKNSKLWKEPWRADGRNTVNDFQRAIVEAARTNAEPELSLMPENGGEARLNTTRNIRFGDVEMQVPESQTDGGRAAAPRMRLDLAGQSFTVRKLNGYTGRNVWELYEGGRTGSQTRLDFEILGDAAQGYTIRFINFRLH